MKDSRCHGAATFLATDAAADRFKALLNDLDCFRALADDPARFRVLASALERARTRAHDLAYDVALDLEFADTCQTPHSLLDLAQQRARDLADEFDMLACFNNLDYDGKPVETSLVVANIVKPKSPAFGERLLCWLASATWDEAVAGDFLELFNRNKRCAGHHVLLAKCDYWWQVLRSVPGFMKIRMRNALRCIRHRDHLQRAAAELSPRAHN